MSSGLSPPCHVRVNNVPLLPMMQRAIGRDRLALKQLRGRILCAVVEGQTAPRARFCFAGKFNRRMLQSGGQSAVFLP